MNLATSVESKVYCGNNSSYNFNRGLRAMMHSLSRLFLLSALFILPYTTYGQAPANDECAGAITVGSLPYTNTQNTRLATPNVADPILLCADSGHGKTVWYQYTADSTTYVSFSTSGSTPTTYDVALGLYTGTCGALVEVECNDDIIPGSVRQAEITYLVQAGTTYIIHVAEWKGGGPSGGVPTGGDLLFRVFYDSLKPLYAGPKFGMIPFGASVSTNSFDIAPSAGEQPIVPEAEEAAENDEVRLYPTPDDVMPPLGPKGSNLYPDRGLRATQQASNSRPIVFKSFQGNTATGAIPPDPILAVGPNHVIGCVNSSFKIWDKDGNVLKNISLNSWFVNVRGSVGFSDPQVLYDHYAGRWIMTGLAVDNATQPYSILVSVSDDDNPLGTWYNWNLQGGLGDSVTNQLPDYPQTGYDEQAVYITTRDFNPGFQFSRLRILAKSDLYSATQDTMRWTDLWDFREPDHRTIPLDGIRPSIEYGSPGMHFLVNASPYSVGTFFTVWQITDVLDTPQVSGTNVPVVQYSSAPNGSQPGGGTAFEGGGSAIRHKAVYRDSSLYMVHSIASGTGDAYSAIHYVRINPHTSTNMEDMAMGVEGYWHFYPAMMTDGDGNAIITYTRSGTTEYAGAYLSGRRVGDPPGLSPSVPLKLGVAHYEVVASGRNRWGDYMGAGLDPTDSSSVWVNTEFTSSVDQWQTWIGKVKMGPLPGAFIFSEKTAYTFPAVEVGDSSASQNLILTNNGLDSLVISGISLPDSHFILLDMPSFPIGLASFESETLKIASAPERHGGVNGTLSIASNDSINPSYDITLAGSGFIITPAQAGTFYAGSAATDGGRLLTVVDSTGTATGVGPSGYTQVTNLRVRPSTGELVGLVATTDGNAATYTYSRVNTLYGDAHPVSSFSLALTRGLAIRHDSIFVARITGQIYRLNPTTGATTLVASTGKGISGMDFNPLTGQLWFSVRTGVLDQVYKMNFPSGTPILVGRTGLNVSTVEIAFDAAGHLFGVTGSNLIPNQLIVIDTSFGIGTIVGPMGIFACQALAIPPGTILTVPPFGVHGYEFAAKWNLLSIPLHFDTYVTNALFPTATSRAYTYRSGYIPRDTMEIGLGYWLRFHDSLTTSVTRPGVPFLEDSVNVVNNWNIVGSLSSTIPISKVTPVPPLSMISSLYGYADTGYFITDSIHPGEAYWVKVDRDGKLVFKSTAAPARTMVSYGLTGYLNSLNTITLRNSDGKSQTLLIGRDVEGAPDRSMLELPPPPPGGLFDARWASNMLIETHPAIVNEPMEFPLSTRNVSTPLMIRWNMTRQPGMSYTLVANDAGGSVLESRQLLAEGEMLLRQSKFAELRLRVSGRELPSTFALKQNFPNPFNPSTNIHYELPREEFVTLTVFDLLGRKVATLVNERQPGGYHSVAFDAGKVSSGLYFYRLTAGTFADIKKMMLIR